MAACAGVSLTGAITTLVRRFGLLRPHLDARALASLLQESLPVAAAAITVLVYFRIDAFLLVWLRGSRATGVYSAAYGAAFGLTFIPAMFQRAHLPVFAAARTDTELKHELRRRARTYGVSAIGATAFLLALTPVISRLYGADFGDMRMPYLILACAQAVFFLNNVAYTVLLARGRSGSVWMLAALRLGGNVTANLLLIPIFGVAGAALGATLAELMLLAAQSALIRNMLGRDEQAHAVQPVPLQQPAREVA
jgi:O-antigen/teichoic acid export membrane protein